MCETRESVYSQLAKLINDFSLHKLNKIEFYNSITDLIEIADEFEKEDRIKYKNFWKENENFILSPDEIPYSNWKWGLDIVSE